MDARAVFPQVPLRTGMYESFYLRAVSPTEPVGVWIRHTVHKARGCPARGSVWCTVFDAAAGRPFMHKLSSQTVRVPAGGWIAIAEHASMGEGKASGSCGDARWSLTFSTHEAELRHLNPGWLYRSAIPRTKLTSPAPSASFEGVLELGGGRSLNLDGWHGMVGHNWGSEHAERWIWLHGVDFEQAEGAWLDMALGRLAVAGRTAPWVANGALCLDGRRYRLGGLLARGLRVSESARGCELSVTGEHGVKLAGRVEVPGESAAGWRYADPDGGEHDVVNCSVAELDLTVEIPGAGAPVALRTAHGGAYELGTRERDHGVPVADFDDG
jgi:hypothetical protein